MTQEDEVLKNAAATAEFRFGLIAPVIQGLFPDASATAYYKRIAQKEFTLPDGTVKKLSYKRGIIRMCGGVAAPGGTPHPCSA